MERRTIRQHYTDRAIMDKERRAALRIVSKPPTEAERESAGRRRRIEDLHEDKMLALELAETWDVA